jgi:hypothetical protein
MDVSPPGRNLTDFEKRGWRWEYHPQISLTVRAVAYEVSQQRQERVLQETRFEYDPRDLELVREQTGEKTLTMVRNRYGLPVVHWDSRGCATVFRYYRGFDSERTSALYGGLLAESTSDAPEGLVAAILREADRPQGPAGLTVRQAQGEPCSRVIRYRYDRYGHIIEEEHPGYRIDCLWNKRGVRLAILDTRHDLKIYDHDLGLRRTAEWQRIQRLKGTNYRGETRPDAEGYFAVARLHYDAFGRLATWNPTLELLAGGQLQAPGSALPVLSFRPIEKAHHALRHRCGNCL